MGQEIAVAGSREELLRDMHERLGEEERASHSVAFHVDVEERPDELPGRFPVLAVALARVLSAGPDCGHGLEMPGYFPVEVYVGKYRLAAPRYRLLGVLEDQHLGELVDFGVAHAFYIWGEEEVYSVPAYRPREMALEGGGELHHVREKDFGMFRGFCHRERVRHGKPELLHVLKRLPRAVRPVHEAQVVQVQVSPHVRVRHVLGEHLVQRVFFLYALGQGEVGRLRPVRDIGVLFVLAEDEPLHVVERHAQAHVLSCGRTRRPYSTSFASTSSRTSAAVSFRIRAAVITRSTSRDIASAVARSMEVSRISASTILPRSQVTTWSSEVWTKSAMSVVSAPKRSGWGGVRIKSSGVSIVLLINACKTGAPILYFLGCPLEIHRFSKASSVLNPQTCPQDIQYVAFHVHF